MSKKTSKYCNAMTGETWSGRGPQPKWLKAAMASGRKLSEFEVGAEAPVVTEVDFEAELTRDNGGYGAVSGFRTGDFGTQIGKADLAEVYQELEARGFQVHVTTLREDYEANKPTWPGPDDLLNGFIDKDDVSVWHPAPPAGNGWKLLAVLHNGELAEDECDVYAVFARAEADAQADSLVVADEEDPNWGTHGHARAFMLGRMMDVAKKRFTTLAERWSALPQREQEAVLRGLQADMKEVVKDAVKIIAANARVTFRAEVESVQFKGPSDVKASLKLVNTPESHALADTAGGFVTIVIESLDELLVVPEAATQGDVDQKPLFDASTEGSAADTEPETAEA